MARTLSGKLDNNNVNVASAGTRVQFDTAKHVLRSISIKALKGNMGDVYIGGSAVSSTRGLPMLPGELREFTFGTTEVKLSEFWVDADNNDDKIAWLAVFK